MPFRKAYIPGKKKATSRGLFEGETAATPRAYLVAHIDGGARGNPGPAGYGAVIEDEAGRPVAQLSEFLGVRTNNWAEYSGLLAALRYALEHGHSGLKVLSDSELLVKQMRGEYKVKSPDLKELYEQARALVRRLEFFEIRHVRREENRNADRLANDAMDKGSGRAVAQARASAGAPPREVTGIVRDGKVEFLGEELPEGTRVKVRPVGS
jgi:ribonuclease HI